MGLRFDLSQGQIINILQLNIRRHHGCKPHVFPRRVILGMVSVCLGATSLAQAQKSIEWRYGHMNCLPALPASRLPGWPKTVEKHTNGQIKIKVYPASSLGKLQELAEAVSTGTIALSHNTAAGIGSLHEPFAALDTPYLYRDIDHLMKTVDVDSPVMKKLNEGLIKSAGVRGALRLLFRYPPTHDQQGGDTAWPILPV